MYYQENLGLIKRVKFLKRKSPETSRLLEHRGHKRKYSIKHAVTRERLYNLYKAGYSVPQIINILKREGLAENELEDYYEASLSLASGNNLLGSDNNLSGFFKRLGRSIKKIVKHPKKALKRVLRKPGDFLLTAGLVTGAVIGGKALLAAAAKRKAAKAALKQSAALAAKKKALSAKAKEVPADMAEAVIERQYQADSTMIDKALETQVTPEAVEKSGTIINTVEKIMPLAKEAAPLVTPMIIDKLQQKGIYPETATEEDIRETMSETISTPTILGMPWYIPAIGAVGGILLITRRR